LELFSVTHFELYLSKKTNSAELNKLADKLEATFPDGRKDSLILLMREISAP